MIWRPSYELSVGSCARATGGVDDSETGMSTFLHSLGIELPIIQAPMAGAQGSALAIAVSNAGGLGSLPCALLDAAGIQRELTALRAGTTKPFNVNFVCHPQPVVDPARDALWRATLQPYLPLMPRRRSMLLAAAFMMRSVSSPTLTSPSTTITGTARRPPNSWILSQLPGVWSASISRYLKPLAFKNCRALRHTPHQVVAYITIGVALSAARSSASLGGGRDGAGGVRATAVAAGSETAAAAGGAAVRGAGSVTTMGGSVIASEGGSSANGSAAEMRACAPDGAVLGMAKLWNVRYASAPPQTKSVAANRLPSTHAG